MYAPPVEEKPVPELTKIPIYEQPPPRPLPSLPNDKFTLTNDEYFKKVRAKDNIISLEESEVVLQQLVLEEIGKREEIWIDKSSYLKNRRLAYIEVAIRVYQRTKCLLTVCGLRNFFKTVKDDLCKRLHQAIVKDKKTTLEVEHDLWKWELYGFCRFLRPLFKEYTEEREKGNAIVLGDDDNNDDDANKRKKNDDDDVEVVFATPIQQPTPASADAGFSDVYNLIERKRPNLVPLEDCVQAPSADRVIKGEQLEEELRQRHMRYYDYEMYQFAETNEERVADDNTFMQSAQGTSGEPSSSFGVLSQQHTPALPTLDQDEIDMLISQVRMVAQKQPSRGYLLKGAIFQIVSRIETRVCNSLEDVFKDLAK